MPPGQIAEAEKLSLLQCSRQLANTAVGEVHVYIFSLSSASDRRLGAHDTKVEVVELLTSDMSDMMRSSAGRSCVFPGRRRGRRGTSTDSWRNTLASRTSSDCRASWLDAGNEAPLLKLDPLGDASPLPYDGLSTPVLTVSSPVPVSVCMAAARSLKYG